MEEISDIFLEKRVKAAEEKLLLTVNDENKLHYLSFLRWRIHQQEHTVLTNGIVLHPERRNIPLGKQVKTYDSPTPEVSHTLLEDDLLLYSYLMGHTRVVRSHSRSVVANKDRLFLLRSATLLNKNCEKTLKDEKKDAFRKTLNFRLIGRYTSRSSRMGYLSYPDAVDALLKFDPVHEKFGPITYKNTILHCNDPRNYFVKPHGGASHHNRQKKRNLIV